MSEITTDFDLNCRACSRLAAFLDQDKIDYPDYHARPITPFGVKKTKHLIVDLAPGMHDADDKLKLKQCRITNAVKCLPPENKPTGEEIKSCNAFLKNEHPFGHGTEYRLARDLILVSSYHCSRYNTSTKRLTPKMFGNVFKQIDGILGR